MIGNMRCWIATQLQLYCYMLLHAQGVGMGTTRGGKKLTEALVTPMCPQDKIADQVKLVTLFFGSNDGSPVMNNVTRRMVPLDEYKQNIEDMVTMFKGAGVRNILLITAPPRGAYDPSVMQPYADAVLAIGQAHNVPVADFFRAIQEVPAWKTEALRSDRLHLSAVGNQVLYITVMSVIQSSLPAVAPKAMQASVSSYMESIPATV
jgi:lysophospholipase L1-like esterase